MNTFFQICVSYEACPGFRYVIGENIGASLSAITCSAVYNAIGKWALDFPVTPEKVLKALRKI